MIIVAVTEAGKYSLGVHVTQEKKYQGTTTGSATMSQL